MRERLDGVVEQLKELRSRFGAMDKKIKMIVIGSIAAVAIVVVGAAVVLNTSDYVPMFTQVEATEAATIVAAVQELGGAAQYSSNGDILVPSDEVDSLRAQMVIQGYPKSGFAYDTYISNADMLATEADKNTYKIFDMQDRLAATIKLIDGIKDAKIFLNIAEKKQSYAIDKDKSESSASVMLVTDGSTISNEQVQGIQRLVGKTVDGLKTEDVVILDQSGRDLTSLGDMVTQSGAAKLKAQLQHDTEIAIQSKIMNQLGAMFGEAAVRVAVNCEMNVDKKIQEIITYLPSTEGGDKGFVDKEQTGVEIMGQGTASAGVVGTDSNAEVPQYPNITTDGNEIYYTDNKSYEYLYSQVKEQVQSDSGVQKNLTVSVTIDDPELKTSELRELKTLVAVTAGIPLVEADEKVVVHKAKFADAEPASGEFFKENSGLLIGIGVGAIILVIGLAAIMMILKKRKAKMAAMVEEVPIPEMDISEGIAKIGEIPNSREQELKNEIRDFADQNPEIAAQLIKNWLKGGDGQ